MSNNVDISENDIFQRYPETLEKLLEDHTTHENIFWATDSYTDKGDGFQYHETIIA